MQEIINIILESIAVIISGGGIAGLINTNRKHKKSKDFIKDLKYAHKNLKNDYNKLEK